MLHLGWEQGRPRLAGLLTSMLPVTPGGLQAKLQCAQPCALSARNVLLVGSEWSSEHHHRRASE